MKGEGAFQRTLNLASPPEASREKSFHSVVRPTDLPPQNGPGRVKVPITSSSREKGASVSWQRSVVTPALMLKMVAEECCL